MKKIKEFIKKAYDETPDNIHAVGYGLKQKGDTYTDELCIVYNVLKKIPKDQIPENELIPEKVIIDGKEYSTDVVENEMARALSCYNYDAEPPPSEVLTNRTFHRPISGGLIIGNVLTWEQPSSNTLNYSWGTLGLIAVDNKDNTLVGLTNNHVIIEDGFITTERDPAGLVYNILDSKTYNNPSNYILTGTIQPQVSQFGYVYINNQKYLNFNLSMRIGQPKRYVPFYSAYYNFVDAALLTLDDETIADYSSTSQNGLDGTLGITFATTSEIDSLKPGLSILNSSGARTGVKGDGCTIVVNQIAITGGIYQKKQGNDVGVYFQDLISFRNADLSTYPVDHGDSGSAVIANINGTKKVIGLVFAGDSRGGLLCRIDHISEILDISAWDGSPVNYTPNPPAVSTFVRPVSDDRAFIDYDGKTYWQVGMTLSKNSITEI